MNLLFLFLITIIGIAAIGESIRVFAEAKISGERIVSSIPVTLLIGVALTAAMLLCIDYALRIGFWA